MAEIKGYIHSVESLGTVDGPGLRFVVFLSGCPMRCAYCHNPDTWQKNGKEMTADEIMKQFDSVKEFLRGGGITCTGGEPLMQAEFVAELFAQAKKRGVHTCLDTSGICWTEDTDTAERIDRVLDFTDLVMLDIKHINPEKHKWLTGQDNAGIKRFAEHLSERGIDVWIRHVLVPGITDDETSLTELGEFIGGIRTLKAIDVLPYHTMGIVKYENLGIPYRLKDVPAATKAQAKAAREIIFRGVKKRIAEDINRRKAEKTAHT
jgi:pyruvate formate lyase activating enzyme